MKISRKGSFANHGVEEREFKKSAISWNEKLLSIEVSGDGVPDFSTNAHHNYVVSISLNDFAKMLECLGQQIEKTSGPAIAESIKSALPDLLRLELCSIGVIRLSGNAAK